MKLLKAPTETAAITVEPGGLAGLENLKPSWDELRDREKQMNSCKSQLIVFAAMSGASLYVMKKSLGYDVRGGDRRSNPTGSGLIATWNDLCRAELNITDDTANKRINIFLTAVDRAKDLEGGEQSPEFRVLTTPPALLNSDDLETMADALEKLLPEKNQNQLLRKIRPANAPKAPHTLTAEDRKKAAAAAAESKEAAKKSTITPAKARILMDDFGHSLISLETDCGRLIRRDDPEEPLKRDFKNSLLILPLDRTFTPDQKVMKGLRDYRDEFEILKTAIEADLATILSTFDKFIDAKMAGDAATAADVSKRVRKSSKPSKK